MRLSNGVRAALALALLAATLVAVTWGVEYVEDNALHPLASNGLLVLSATALVFSMLLNRRQD